LYRLIDRLLCLTFNTYYNGLHKCSLNIVLLFNYINFIITCKVKTCVSNLFLHLTTLLIDRLLCLTFNTYYNGTSRGFIKHSSETRGPPTSVLLICLFMHRLKLYLFRQVFHTCVSNLFIHLTTLIYYITLHLLLHITLHYSK
jgi:hypothetical protein